MFTHAPLHTHRASLQVLNREYMQWVGGGLEQLTGRSAFALWGMDAAAYADSMLDSLCGEDAPKGAFYVVELQGQLAGMCGLRAVAPGVAEIKRLYVRPAQRGHQLGDAMVAHLLADARRWGMTTVRLDSAPFMQSAHRLYERCGFVDCAAYSGTEVPEALHPVWRFMQRGLT